MKLPNLFISALTGCLLVVGTSAQTAQAQLGPEGSLAELLGQSLEAQGYEVRRDGTSVIFATNGGEISLDLPATGEELEDSEIQARLVPQADESAEDPAENIDDFQQLERCLDAVNILNAVNQALCNLNPNEGLCLLEAFFARVINTLKCVAVYDDSEPPSGDVVSVFVTKRRYAANLGGLADADRRCQRKAEAAGLGGTWTAWLSDSTENAFDRIPDGQYQLVNGTGIADDKGDLTDGFLKAAINLNEYGQAQGGFAWTGTAPDGTGTGNNCSDWTVNSSESGGDRGSTGSINEEWTKLNAAPAQCSERYRLYCFGEGVE